MTKEQLKSKLRDIIIYYNDEGTSVCLLSDDIDEIIDKIADLFETNFKQQKFPKKILKLQFEDHNFRVPSYPKWRQFAVGDNIYAEAPTKDIWKIVRCPVYPNCEGEQLFTWDAAMRETKKTGKRMPDEKWFDELLTTKSDMPNLVLAGYRCIDGTFNNHGTYGYFWTSTESGSNAWERLLHSDLATVNRYVLSKEYGFSVRCLVN